MAFSPEFLAKIERKENLRARMLDLADKKGRKEYFELRPKHALEILPTDNMWVVRAKEIANGQVWRGDKSVSLPLGGLYMYRNTTAAELAAAWKAQGWHSLVVRRTYLGYRGPQYNSKLIRILEGMGKIGKWTMCDVECCWSVVFATEKPESIEVFKPLLLPKDR